MLRVARDLRLFKPSCEKRQLLRPRKGAFTQEVRVQLEICSERDTLSKKDKRGQQFIAEPIGN